MRTHSGTSARRLSASNSRCSCRHVSIALARIVEPQQQPVAELLHDPRAASGSAARTSLLLPFEQRERDVVAVLVGELR